MRRAAIFPAALLTSAVLAGCGSGSTGSERTVVAAFYPLAWVADRVADDGTEVVDLTPPGVEPHDLELTARDVERVREAELVLYLGGGFMPALEDALGDGQRALDLLDGQEILRGDHGHEDEEDEGHEDEEGVIDPHVWLDPTRLAVMARTIAEELGDAGAADEVVDDLESLDGEFRRGLAECERREIVTSHAAFAYLAEAYGLRQIALSGLSPEAEPSPRALEALVAEVEEVGATTVFFETLVSPRVAETVAREAGIETAALNPLEGLTPDQVGAGEDYLSVMRSNLAVLREALGCR
jgi:zinc transport system substrate-binding protein